MKRTFLYGFVLLAAVAGCSERPADDISTGEVQQGEKIDTGFTALMGGATKTTVDFASGEGIVKWLTDDPVFITNGTQTATYYIKQGGSTSSPLYTDGKALDGDAFCAVYPSSGAAYEDGLFKASIPVSQTYKENGFNTRTFPMVAVCGEDRVLNFKNAAALLKIVPTADWGGKLAQVVITAEKPIAGQISVSYDGSAAPEVSCSGSKTVTVNCGNAELGDAIYAVVAPGEYENLTVSVSMATGLTVTVPMEQSVKVDRSKFATVNLNLADRFVDLSKDGTANCYVLTKPGSYRIKASVRGNGVETSCGITSVNEDAAGVSEYFADGATFISGGYSYMNGYIYFSTVDAETLPVGTSLICLKDTAGKVIWSWHIWAQPQIADIELGGNTWMNMNLGAHSTQWNDEGYMGYYYQWGRKDPMQQKYTSAADFKNPWASHASMTDGSIDNSILYPANFYGSYHTASDPTTISDWSAFTDDMSQVVWDWWCKGLSGNTQSGEVVKTMWDPCPVGYHVPSVTDINNLGKTNVTWDAYDDANHSHKKDDFLIPTLSHRGVGVSAGNWKGATMDTPAYLWTAFPGTAKDKGKVNGWRAWFRNQSTGCTEVIRSYGVPVRCVAEK